MRVWITAGVIEGHYSNGVAMRKNAAAAKIERCHRNDCDEDHDNPRAEQFRPMRPAGGCCASRYRLTRFCVPLQPLKISANVGGVLVPEISILLQTFRNDSFQFGW